MGTSFYDILPAWQEMHLILRMDINNARALIREDDAILSDARFSEHHAEYHQHIIADRHMLASYEQQLLALNQLISQTYPDFSPPLPDKHWFEIAPPTESPQ